jgi:hypothetical protein
MTTDHLVILLGIASSITLIISALSVHRKRLLMFGIATGSLVAIQYGLVGSWVALMTLSIGLVWTVMMLLSAKHAWLKNPLLIPLFMVFHVTSFAALSNWDAMTWVNFIPLIGGWGSLIALFMTDMIKTKSALILLGGMWLAYEYSSGLYGQMVGESLNLVANTVALSALITARRRGIPEDQMEDLDTQLIGTITTSIPTITQAIHLPTPPVPGAHPSSVQYARYVEKHRR